MNRISRFLKLRKQNDALKLAVFMFLLSAVFILSGIINMCKYFASSSATVEYTLIPDFSASLVGEKIGKLSEGDDVISASLQRRYTILAGDTQIPIALSEVSGEYLTSCYHIESDSTATEKFYLNKAAFDLICDAPDEASVRKGCTLDGASAHQALFVRCDSIGGDDPIAFRIGTSVSLNAKTSDSVRIMYRNSDITDAREKSLKNDGYSIENQLDLIKASYEKELLLKTLMYDILIIAISFVCGVSLLRRIKNI